MKEIYWHLPGFTGFFYLNQVIIRMMKEHPEWFREGYRVGSVYGTFPGAIWNGGRAVFGMTVKGDMEKIISTYNRLGVPVRFTWTNSMIEEKHLQDTYCNLIMSVADNGMNQVLVNTDLLEAYLREHYPRFQYISSTTKRIVSPQRLREELDRDYMLVVLDYDLNHDSEVLTGLEAQADRIEILVDEICFPGCPKRKAHYREESLRQLSFDRGEPFPCPNRTTKPAFAECMKRPAFIAADEVSAYAEKGFCNFKLVGRGLPEELVMDSYMYYLVREEYRTRVRSEIGRTLEKLTGRRK